MGGMGGMGGMEEMTRDAAVILPELGLLTWLVVGLVLGLFLPRERQWLVALGTAGTLLAALVVTVLRVSAAPGPVFEGTLVVDGAHVLLRVVVLAAALLTVCLSIEPLRAHPRETEYHVALTAASLGALLLGATTDLILLVVAFLLASTPLYFLAGVLRDDAGVEAGAKTFLLGALSGGVLLYGVALLYGLSGGAPYPFLAEALAAGGDGLAPAAALGAVAVLTGLAFKLGAVPAHFWVPDLCQGSPAPVAAFATTVPKVAGLLAAGRLVTALGTEPVDPALLVAGVAAATMTLGNLAALWQDDVRRLLGWSAVSQVGYLLMGVAALGRSALAVPALLLYAAAYAVMNVGAFAVVAELPAATTLDDHAGLARRHPLLAAALATCLLSLVGIPPLAGFLGKLAVFGAAIDADLAWLAALAAANTALSVFYYLRWLVPAFLRPPGDAALLAPAGTWGRVGALSAAVATLGLGLAAELVTGLAPEALRIG